MPENLEDAVAHLRRALPHLRAASPTEEFIVVVSAKGAYVAPGTGLLLTPASTVTFCEFGATIDLAPQPSLNRATHFWAANAADLLDEIDTAPARSTDPQTSKAAARKLTATNACGKLATQFYDEALIDAEMVAVAPAGNMEGLTPTAAVKHAGLTHLRCPWKRVSDLKAAGIIEPTGYTVKDPETGMEQEKLRITEHGKREVERLGLA